MTDAQQLHILRQRLLDVDSALQAGQEFMAMAMLLELIDEAKAACKRGGKMRLSLSTWYNAAYGKPAFDDAPELGMTPNAIRAMRHLGISYELADPRPATDSWIFEGCTNVPDELPFWLTVIG